MARCGEPAPDMLGADPQNGMHTGLPPTPPPGGVEHPPARRAALVDARRKPPRCRPGAMRPSGGHGRASRRTRAATPASIARDFGVS